MAPNGTLVLLPSLRAVVGDDGRIGLTKKFVEGMTQWVEHWDGPVRVIIEPTPDASTDLDHALVDPTSLPFALEVGSYTSDDFVRFLRGASIVAASCSYRQNHVAQACQKLGVACVYGSEYTLATRLQIIDADTRNPLLKLRRYLWEWNQERRQTDAIRQATGIQCNGTPTYDAYRSLNRRPLLFFDTRTTEDMVIHRESLESRLVQLSQKKPLRLAFSGRLEPMKGVAHLPRIAHELRELGVPFHMSIFGDGRERSSIGAEVRRLQLEGQVELRGVVPFKQQLVPWVRDNVDVFVCPHLQGDPSCTYLETFACGVPIAGFDNEALRGLLALAPTGWSVPSKDDRRLAARLAELDRDRSRIAEASRAALEFARDHTFEKTFKRRTDHLNQCVASFSSRPAGLEASA